MLGFYLWFEMYLKSIGWNIEFENEQKIQWFGNILNRSLKLRESGESVQEKTIVQYEINIGTNQNEHFKLMLFQKVRSKNTASKVKTLYQIKISSYLLCDVDLIKCSPSNRSLLINKIQKQK